MALVLRTQLSGKNSLFKQLLEDIPAASTVDEIYFYIWSQTELLPIPKSYNIKCVEILINWFTIDDIDLMLKLRPLAYKSEDFQDLYKNALNRKVIFRDAEIARIDEILGLSIPDTLYNFVDWVKSIPIYIQYALVVTYFMRIPNAFFGEKIFIEYVCNGPHPPPSDESLRTRWKTWTSKCDEPSCAPPPIKVIPKIRPHIIRTTQKYKPCIRTQSYSTERPPRVHPVYRIQ